MLDDYANDEIWIVQRSEAPSFCMMRNDPQWVFSTKDSVNYFKNVYEVKHINNIVCKMLSLLVQLYFS